MARSDIKVGKWLRLHEGNTPIEVVGIDEFDTGVLVTYVEISNRKIGGAKMLFEEEQTFFDKY